MIPQQSEEDRQAEWLDRVMRTLLPKQIYDRAHQTSTQEFVRQWTEKHGISVATQDGALAVLQDGKVMALYAPQPEEEPNAETQ